MTQQTTLKPNALPGPLYASFAGKAPATDQVVVCDASLTDLSLYDGDLLDEPSTQAKLTDKSQAIQQV